MAIRLGHQTYINAALRDHFTNIFQSNLAFSINQKPVLVMINVTTNNYLVGTTVLVKYLLSYFAQLF
jgi:uncharacterized membrane protein